MCFRARNSGKANPYVVFLIAAVASLVVLIFVAPEQSMDVTANSYHVETNTQVAKASTQSSSVASHQREDEVRFESFQAKVAQKQAAIEAQAAEPQIEEMLVVAPRLTALELDFDYPEIDIAISTPAKPNLDNI